VFLIAWELYGRSLNPIFLSYPVAIVSAAVELIRSGELVAALLKSLQGLAVGFQRGGSWSGVTLGLLMGRYPLAVLCAGPLPRGVVCNARGGP